MSENGMVGGEGRYFDDRANRASDLAKLAGLYVDDFKQAIQRGDSTAMVPAAQGRTALLDIIGDSLYSKGLAEQLVRAISETANGRYERGSKALLEWLDAAGLAYGIEQAEVSE